MGNLCKRELIFMLISLKKFVPVVVRGVPEASVYGKLTITYDITAINKNL